MYNPCTVNFLYKTSYIIRLVIGIPSKPSESELCSTQKSGHIDEMNEGGCDCYIPPLGHNNKLAHVLICNFMSLYKTKRSLVSNKR